MLCALAETRSNSISLASLEFPSAIVSKAVGMPFNKTWSGIRDCLRQNMALMDKYSTLGILVKLEIVAGYLQSPLRPLGV